MVYRLPQRTRSYGHSKATKPMGFLLAVFPKSSNPTMASPRFLTPYLNIHAMHEYLNRGQEAELKRNIVT